MLMDQIQIWQRSGDDLPPPLCQLILLKTFTASKLEVNLELGKRAYFLSTCMVTLSNIVSHLEKKVSVYLLCNKHSSFCSQLFFYPATSFVFLLHIGFFDLTFSICCAILIFVWLNKLATLKHFEERIAKTLPVFDPVSSQL